MISCIGILNLRKRNTSISSENLLTVTRNFLYDPEKRQGVLVDFGLAEVCFLDTYSAQQNRL
jgi:hypothetical protein